MIFFVFLAWTVFWEISRSKFVHDLELEEQQIWKKLGCPRGLTTRIFVFVGGFELEKFLLRKEYKNEINQSPIQRADARYTIVSTCCIGLDPSPQGYRFKGTAEIHAAGPVLEDFIQRYTGDSSKRTGNRAGNRTGVGGLIQAAVLVRVAWAAPLVSPGYVGDITESQMRSQWEAYFAGLKPPE